MVYHKPVLGKENALRSHVNQDPGDHNYGRENREAFYRMVGDFFFAGDKSYNPVEIPSDAEVKTKDDLASIYDNPDPKSAVAARLQAGVIAQVKRCAAGWCRVSGNGFDGWIEQQRLWGVYADEKVD